MDNSPESGIPQNEVSRQITEKAADIARSPERPKTQGKVLLTVDDVTTKEELDGALKVNKVFPEMSASVDVSSAVESTTNNEQKKFFNDHKADFLKLNPGIHIDLFDFPTKSILYDHYQLFGKKGALLKLLTAREQGNQDSPAVSVNSLWKESILREILQQIQTFEEIFGQLPSHLSYHFGLHNIPEILILFEQVASELKLPFRKAQKYTHEDGGSSPHPDAFSDKQNIVNETPTAEALSGILLEENKASNSNNNTVPFIELGIHINQVDNRSQEFGRLFSQLETRQLLEGRGWQFVSWQDLAKEKQPAVEENNAQTGMLS